MILIDDKSKLNYELAGRPMGTFGIDQGQDSLATQWSHLGA